MLQKCDRTESHSPQRLSAELIEPSLPFVESLFKVDSTVLQQAANPMVVICLNLLYKVASSELRVI